MPLSSDEVHAAHTHFTLTVHVDHDAGVLRTGEVVVGDATLDFRHVVLRFERGDEETAAH